MELKRSLLPLGSVVRLEDNGDRDFMVYARMVVDDRGRAWDYLVCAFPEGFMPGNGEFGDYWFADRGQVSRLVFVGYQGGRELEFREFLEHADLEESTWRI